MAKKKKLKLEFVEWETDALIPNPNNPRVNDDAVEKLAEIINKSGFVDPILIKKSGKIVDGHLRRKTALFLGLKTVPCIIVDGLTEKQLKYLSIAHNRAAEFAEWDERSLSIELTELEGLGVEFGELGFASIDNEFTPSFTPDFSTSEVTEEDVSKKSDDMEDPYEDKKAAHKVTCPGCAHEFEYSGY